MSRVKPITVYVAMALTGAPKDFVKDFQQYLKDGLRGLAAVKVVDFIGLENGDETDVYKYDRQCVETSDYCAIVCDHASTGMGMEIAFRLATGKPMGFFAETHSHITRMVTGCAKVENIPFHRYTSVTHLIDMIKLQLAELE